MTNRRSCLAALMLFALPAFSQNSTLASTETNFKVDQIEPAKLMALKSADAELSKATAALAVAQQVVQDAKAKSDTARAAITSQYNTFEGQCSFSGSYSLEGPGRSYRRAEIRGGYILLSEGRDRCSTMTGTVSIVGSGTTTIDPKLAQ